MPPSTPGGPSCVSGLSSPFHKVEALRGVAVLRDDPVQDVHRSGKLREDAVDSDPCQLTRVGDLAVFVGEGVTERILTRQGVPRARELRQDRAARVVDRPAGESTLRREATEVDEGARSYLQRREQVTGRFSIGCTNLRAVARSFCAAL
jgi:hypothetical protein